MAIADRELSIHDSAAVENPPLAEIEEIVRQAAGRLLVGAMKSVMDAGYERSALRAALGSVPPDDAARIEGASAARIDRLYLDERDRCRREFGASAGPIFEAILDRCAEGCRILNRHLTPVCAAKA